MEKKFSKDGYQIPQPMSYWMLWFGSLFTSKLKHFVNQWGKEKSFDNSLSKKVLGIEYRKFDNSVIDMCQSLIDTGYVPKGSEMKPKSQSLSKMVLIIATIGFIGYTLNTKYQWVNI